MPDELHATSWRRASEALKKIGRENGLSMAMFLLFSISLMGQALTGLAVRNDEALKHGGPTIALLQYVTSGDFIEAVFENWESEFLQMAVFVVLTKFLRQRGSSESKSLDEPDPVDEDPRNARNDPSAPWPVRRGGLVLALYERSLSLALSALFLASFSLHAWGGADQYNEDQLRHGGAAVGFIEFLGTSTFWQQSFQNWQSEFLSITVIVLLSIVLRERGSSQSKPVAAPHAQTGE